MMKSGNIIIVEDETDIREVMEYNLLRDGYAVHSTGDGENGLTIIKKEMPDLVILDLMLPGMDGLEVCRKLKSDPAFASIYIIMVTARGEESDIVLGLGLGADDYVTKPFSIKELLARVKAVLRRRQAKGIKDETERIVRDNLIIDAGRHQVKIDSRPVVFTTMEFKLLYFLASHPGRVFTRDQLLSNTMGDDACVIDRNIDVHIRSIRKKLGNCNYLIDTIRGIGYRFIEDEE